MEADADMRSRKEARAQVMKYFVLFAIYLIGARGGSCRSAGAPTGL